MAVFSSSILGSPSPLSVPTLPTHKYDSSISFLNVKSTYPMQQANHVGLTTTKVCQTVSRKHKRTCLSVATKSEISALVPEESPGIQDTGDFGILSIHHVGLLCENLERSLEFYQNLLGLKINEARPHDKFPFRGAWLWVGSEMIHLMELPNPDPLTGRPEHGGRDRHTCIAIKDVSKLKKVLDKAGIVYTLSRSGRPAIFTHDPDANALEFAQV